MLTKGFLEEVTTVMQQYRATLSPGNYVFTPELRLGKMTGKIIEERSDHPDGHLCPAEPGVTFGFHPLGLAPACLKGAPPSWLSGYPYLPGIEKLTEAPQIFLELLKLHVEERLQCKKQQELCRPAEHWPTEAGAAAPEDIR